MTTLAPGASADFWLAFKPLATGPQTATLHIASNDADESPFDIALGGTGAVPEIVIQQPFGTNLSDGVSTVGFSNVVVGSSATLTFTILNSGLGPLTGIGITTNGVNAADFSVSALAGSTMEGGDSMTFTVTFPPTVIGMRTATIHVGSNDADENPFDVSLTGTGIGPEIEVENPVGNGLVDGSASLNFGDVGIGANAPLTVTVRNSGLAPLTGLAVSKSGSNAGLFSVSALGATSLAGGSSTTFTVTFTPIAIGARTAGLQIASNDADENPFEISLQGTGTTAPVLPEIAVEQPTGVELTDGSATPVNFGIVTGGSSGVLTFTVRNKGAASLTGLAVTKATSGTPGDFTVVSLGATTLTPNATTTFTVTFSPVAAGVRTATLQIASNDADENPYDIILIGTRATALEAWRQAYFGSTANTGAGADLNDADGDGIANLMEFATSSGPLTPNPQPGQLVKSGSTLEFSYTRPKAALGELAYDVEWRESLNATWSAVGGTSPTILTDNGVLQTVRHTVPAGANGKRFVRLRVTRNG